MSLRRAISLLTVVSTVTGIGCPTFGEDPPAAAPRMTPLVRVIQQIEPGVAALFTSIEGGIASGSGTVIHPDGFVLTNNHVLPKATGYALLKDGKPLQFHVVGRLPDKDIAVVQLIGMQTPLPTIPLGRSHDILNGESVVVAGNPGGRGTVFTSGIVSSRRVLGGGQNALVMSSYDTAYYDTYIQFDAASNRGNSGGPLINMDGELIGVVSALVAQEQNVGLAIPVDLVWERFGDVLESELRRGVSTGIDLAPLGRQALVAGVAAASAAANEGVQAGDIIKSVNDRPVRNVVDWQLAILLDATLDRPLDVTVQRADETHEFKLKLQADEGLAGVEVAESEVGLEYKFYHGQFKLVPDFEKLNVVRDGIVPNVDLPAMQQDRADEFAVSVAGFLKVPVDGVYRLIVRSDDGSRVLLHGELLIDNDGNHPPKQAGAWVRLRAGFHPIRVDHFEGNGEQTLQLAIEMPDGTGREVSADMLFH